MDTVHSFRPRWSAPETYVRMEQFQEETEDACI